MTFNVTEKTKEYLGLPLTAGVIIIPIFYGFETKTARQLNLPLPKYNPMEGVYAAPKVAALVGTQLVLQKKLSNEYDGVDKKIQNALMIGFCSTPFVAIFNGQTVGLSPIAAIKKITPKFTASVTARETSFVGSIAVTKNVANQMKKIFGDNRQTEYASAFISGAVGSLIGHPFDTILTGDQAGVKIPLRNLYRGSLHRAGTVGIFATLLELGKPFYSNK